MSGRGRLIALEGVDGCGKSTQARRLADAVGAVLTSEPGATRLGATLRSLALDPELPPVSEHAEALLMAADRAQHVAEVVEPALDAGRWVVTERFSGSTLAYQGYGRGLDLADLRPLVDWASGGVTPDLTLLLDLPAELAHNRLDLHRADRLERLDAGFHERVRAGYRALAAADPGSWVVVDASAEVDTVARELLEIVTTGLGPLPPARPMSAGIDDDVLPALGLFADVVGQADAVEQLRAAARRPVHAYLVVGPPGLGQRPLVRGFAAALLCPHGGDGTCEVCRRALAGIHPDVVEVERTGALLSVDDARRVVSLAQRRPLEARRQVVVVSDIHGARLAAPVLLKTLEEPAGQTVFVLLAEFVPAELATVASRCVRIELRPLPAAALRDWLTSTGTDAALVDELAEAAGGSVDRARLLADDAGFADRRALWRSVPTRLDGTGSAAADLAVELLSSAEDAVAPLRARHQVEMEELEAEAEQRGERSVPRRKEIEDRHKREERRWRTDELRAGLAVLAGAYRTRLTTLTAPAPTPGAWSARTAERVRELADAVTVVERSAAELIRNPNESLLLEAMLVRLSAVTA